MRPVLLLLVPGVWLISGCDVVGNSSRKDSVRKAYLQEMIAPGVEAKTYLSLYTTHKARCESRDSFARGFSCTEARVDLAHIERAWQQLLPVAERMTQDGDLTDVDRKDAQEAVDRLRAGIERIQAAKSKKLPEL